MNIFQSFTLTWWQGALFKWGVFLLGIAVGAYIPVLLVITVVFSAYVTYVWWRQIGAAN